jgi:glycosyltransferase involved in cell wall biosynthesis
MKIGIDTFACGGGASGAGAYLKEILKRWPASETRYTLFGWEYDKYVYDDVTEKLTGCEFVPRCKFKGRTASQIWHVWKYPDFADILAFNACFFPGAHQELPVVSHCPTVGTVHDMAAFWGTRKTREHLGLIRMALPNALRRLDRVIAVSEWVKKELIEIAKVKSSRIEVVYNGVDLSRFRPREQAVTTNAVAGADAEDVLLIQPFSFRRPSILYTSRLDLTVKNHLGLIKAFTIFKETTRLPHRLVLTGPNSLGADKIKEAAAVSKYRGDIFFTGHFPSASLPDLTAAADMVVYPSRYEGFGRGVIEAMAAGVPVACARAASLSEIAANTALFFDPDDAEDIAGRMAVLATDRETRSALISAGLEHAKQFSWEKTAQKTYDIIMETAGQ